MEYFDKLEGLLSSAISNSKLFWKTSNKLSVQVLFQQTFPTWHLKTNMPKVTLKSQYVK